MSSTEAHAHVALLALLLSLGLVDAAAPAHVVRRLRELTWRELALLAHTGLPKFDLRIDERQMDHALRAIRDRLDREDRLDFFIAHGATTAMLRRLFRRPVAELKARRAQLLGAHKQRRPRLPRPEERDAVHRAWWEIRKGRRRQPPTIDDYVYLHRQFPQHTFATLEAIVNEFDE